MVADKGVDGHVCAFEWKQRFDDTTLPVQFFFRALQFLVCGTDLSTNLQHLVRIRAVFLVLLQCNIWFAAVQHFVCCIVQFESTHVTEGAATCEEHGARLEPPDRARSEEVAEGRGRPHPGRPREECGGEAETPEGIGAYSNGIGPKLRLYSHTGCTTTPLAQTKLPRVTCLAQLRRQDGGLTRDKVRESATDI